MLRSMRAKSKYVFFILAGSFVLWLAIGQDMQILEPRANVVLKVNGFDVAVTAYQQRLQTSYEQYRQQTGTTSLSREEGQKIQDQLTNELIQEIILAQEYRKIGSKDRDEDALRRPGQAFVRFVAIPRLRSSADTAGARAHVARIRAELARGAKFEDVACRESSDTVSGRQGGDLGWIKRTERTFDPQFMAALKGLTPGRVSAPALSQFGYHLIRVDMARGDSLKVRHILVPIELQGEHLDAVEARVDSLERLPSDQANGGLPDSAAPPFGLPVSPVYRIVDGERLTLGPYVIPHVSVWAV